MQLDFEEIKKLIPQRFPFIMLDRIVELEPGKRADLVRVRYDGDVPVIRAVWREGVRVA